MAKSVFSKHAIVGRWIVFCASVLIFVLWNLPAMIFVPSQLSAIDRCDVLCGRSLHDCYERHFTVVTIKEGRTLTPSIFQHIDQLHGRNITPIDTKRVTRPGSSDRTTNARTICNVSSIDPAFSTIARRRSCAVVGNSGIILDSGCGSRIDAHDFVMRANFAPVDGYTRDVGKRTDIMLINDVTLRNLRSTLSGKIHNKELGALITRGLRSLNGSILWFPKDAKKHAIALTYVAHEFERRGLNITLAYSLKDIYYDIKVKYNLWRYPSSGLYMLAVAESICDVTSIYGFYPYATTETGHEVLRHYYEPDLKNFHTWAHDFDAEFRMLQSRKDAGLVTMITDTCRPIGR